jgi:hypothetical protein
LSFGHFCYRSMGRTELEAWRGVLSFFLSSSPALGPCAWGCAVCAVRGCSRRGAHETAGVWDVCAWGGAEHKREYERGHEHEPERVDWVGLRHSPSPSLTESTRPRSFVRSFVRVVEARTEREQLTSTRRGTGSCSYTPTCASVGGLGGRLVSLSDCDSIRDRD